MTRLLKKKQKNSNLREKKFGRNKRNRRNSFASKQRNSETAIRKISAKQRNSETAVLKMRSKQRNSRFHQNFALWSNDL